MPDRETTEEYLHFSDCNTKNQFIQCFETYSSFSPEDYIRLALRKLKPRNPLIKESDILGPDQEGLLELILENPSWHSYCESLSVSQIKCVGW